MKEEQKCVSCGGLGHSSCTKGDLSYQEQYEIPLKIVVNHFKAEYAGCGTHQIELNLEVDRKSVKDLLAQINKLRHVDYLTPPNEDQKDTIEESESVDCV